MYRFMAFSCSTSNVKVLKSILKSLSKIKFHLYQYHYILFYIKYNTEMNQVIKWLMVDFARESDNIGNSEMILTCLKNYTNNTYEKIKISKKMQCIKF